MNMIPGLPKDLIVQCLIKVPYKFHNHLRAVCKSWNAVLSSPNFYKERQRHNECEEGIAYFHLTQRPSNWEVIIYYPHGNWLERLPRAPEEFISDWEVYFNEFNFVYVRSKHHLVAIGLLNKYDNRASVLMFDFLSRTWRLGHDMPFRRYQSACAVSPSPNGLVYITGGVENLSENPISPHLLESYVFNVEENKWDVLPRMNPDSPQYYCVAEFVDDRFYVVPDHGRSFQVYDPQIRLWKTINTDNTGEHVVNCISAFGRLYWFGLRRDTLVLEEFDFANNLFTTVGQYPFQIRAVDRAVLCRDCIFVNVLDYSSSLYYLFNLLDKRWTQIEMPAEFPTFSFVSTKFAAVQI
ncbi:hypothetical protein SUGI_0707070 [Cryptomeria japonica]|uniref:F-box/kelch-repeat protein SKIP20-like n=1 Tax=Cryptomeria japonica TaxID=3369 RepID=UPI002414C648|nr:F-box/kelch-repeat protein SKIP20-like [Cryptomeria japonica]GLJ35128.1 hypothetical protein SUGI_0707070 [Cryptomeria japonica]